MNCEDTRKRILDLDNQFEPAAEEAVAAHLAGCPACREFHAEIRRTWDALGRLPELEASPGFHQAVWAKIRARESAPARPGADPDLPAAAAAGGGLGGRRGDGGDRRLRYLPGRPSGAAGRRSWQSPKRTARTTRC